MAVDYTGTFDLPVGCFLFFKPAGVTDVIFRFTPPVFSACHPQYIASLVPESDLSGTDRTIAMGVNGTGKPHPAFKPEGFIGEGANRTNIDHVAREFIVDRLFNISADLRYIAAVQHPMHAVGRKLIRNMNTTVT